MSIHDQNALSIPRRLEAWIAEYEAKVAAIPEAIAAFEAAASAIKAASCIGGTWGEETIDTGRGISERTIERSLLRSAWRHFIAELDLKTLMSPADRKRVDQMLADPLPFDIESLRAVFGDHIQNPRAAVLRGLAEYYGDVLPDCPDWQDGERPEKRTSTAVAKDLQFYPTPEPVIARLLGDWQFDGRRVLEPSCGDGRIMDALRAKGADTWGVEVDAGRAAEAREKGHKVFCSNFLETDGPARAELAFDMVVMNPPFYGRHYAKHVRHAMRFLKPGGALTAILPATARYDHGLLDDLNPSWCDLPVGAFSESGTNVCTTVCTVRKPKESARD